MKLRFFIIVAGGFLFFIGRGMDVSQVEMPDSKALKEILCEHKLKGVTENTKVVTYLAEKKLYPRDIAIILNYCVSNYLDLFRYDSVKDFKVMQQKKIREKNCFLRSFFKKNPATIAQLTEEGFLTKHDISADL